MLKEYGVHRTEAKTPVEAEYLRCCHFKGLFRSVNGVWSERMDSLTLRAITTSSMPATIWVRRVIVQVRSRRERQA